jgi:hypothetical protein
MTDALNHLAEIYDYFYSRGHYKQANKAQAAADEINRLRAAVGGAGGGVPARPLSEWSEEDGDVLWWRFPIDEPPYVGSPLDEGQTVELVFRSIATGAIVHRHQVGGWPGYHTHWSPIPRAVHPPSIGGVDGRLRARAEAAEKEVARLREELAEAKGAATLNLVVLKQWRSRAEKAEALLGQSQPTDGADGGNRTRQGDTNGVAYRI